MVLTRLISSIGSPVSRFFSRRHCWSVARNGKINDMQFTLTPSNRARKAAGTKRLQGPRRAWIVALVVGIPLVTGACAEIIPKIELRDNYMFKRFLQPSRAVSEVKRDEQGNPILPKSQQQPAAN
jgi:hypothetical protein